MIVRPEDKTYEVNSGFLDSNPYEENFYVVDQTQEEGKILAEKIEKFFPFYDFGEIEGELLKSIYAYALVKLSCPAFATVGTQNDISASAEDVEADEQGTGKNATLYIDGVQQATGVLPCTWQVQFDTPGIYEIKVETEKHGTATKEVVVE